MYIRDNILPEDNEQFNVDVDVDHFEFMKNAAIGGKVYLLHESMEEIENDRKRMFQ